NSKNLNGEFSLHSLWKEAHVHHYFYYQGSLIFLPGAKSVIWFVCAVPLEITYPVHKLFTTSLFVTTIKEKRLMQNNFHPLQPLNGQSIYYSYYTTERYKRRLAFAKEISSLCCLAEQPRYQLNELHGLGSAEDRATQFTDTVIPGSLQYNKKLACLVNVADLTGRLTSIKNASTAMPFGSFTAFDMFMLFLVFAAVITNKVYRTQTGVVGSISVNNVDRTLSQQKSLRQRESAEHIKWNATGGGHFFPHPARSQFHLVRKQRPGTADLHEGHDKKDVQTNLFNIPFKRLLTVF
ncbi:hypothetical protein L345_11306, partial [Ophiophagus hannah]